MPSRRSSRPALVVVFVVFAIALPLVGYYLAVELPERAAYFTQSKFRALGVLAEQIESTLENRLNAVKAAATSADGEPARKIGLIRDLTYVPDPLALCRAGLMSSWTSQPTPTAPVSGMPTPSDKAILETLYIEPSAAPPSRNTNLLSIGNTEPAHEEATRKTDSTVYFCHGHL